MKINATLTSTEIARSLWPRVPLRTIYRKDDEDSFPFFFTVLSNCRQTVGRAALFIDLLLLRQDAFDHFRHGLLSFKFPLLPVL